MMGCLVLLLFIFLPFAEMSVLSRVSGIVGAWNTLLLVIFSAFFGVSLARMQGKAVLLKVQQCMSQGRLPAAEMMDGILLFIGGVLFVIPGFITDGIGLLLVFPLSRAFIKWWLSRNVIMGSTVNQDAGRERGFRRNNQRTQERKQSIPEQRGRREDVSDAEIVDK